MIQLTLFFMILVGCMLCNSTLSLYYAAMGLNLWFEKMIPVLLPFMILSGIMVRLKLTTKVAQLFYFALNPFFKVSQNACYAIFMGYLCGFPMGARVIADLYQNSMISKREAEYLLAFCNNIGPVYFCSFVLPLLNRNLLLPYIFGMYGIPLLYGLVLRYTVYGDLTVSSSSLKEQASDYNLLEAVDDSIHAAIRNILTLGGYMILFNLLNLLPGLMFGEKGLLFAPLLEITGGLNMLQDSLPLFSLLTLSFGGLSCLAQTYSCIKETDLSIQNYTIHKIILTLLCALFYFIWYVSSPSSFLR